MLSKVLGPQRWAAGLLLLKSSQSAGGMNEGAPVGCKVANALRELHRGCSGGTEKGAAHGMSLGKALGLGAGAAAPQVSVGREEL